MLSENFRQNCFTLQGKALQKWADTLFLQEHVQAERDFVSEVREYASSSGEKALLVTGLRSTGKTVGILQGLPLEETLYLCPSSKNSIQAEEVLSFLKEIASSEEKPRTDQNRHPGGDHRNGIRSGTRTSVHGFHPQGQGDPYHVLFLFGILPHLCPAGNPKGYDALSL